MSSPGPQSGKPPFDRVVLIGFMGAGKTSVGAQLARLLGWGFLDMDRRIEERTGLTVAQFFRERGEAAFREEEGRVARDATSLTDYVIAAGGGAFTVPETREALQSGALTVWLRCGLDTVLARIPPDGTRPLAPNRAIMQNLLAQREPSYRLADLAVDSSTGSPAEVADRVARVVLGRGGQQSQETPDR